jgi:ubiquinone/menaquinone biosynthesis C-methylase UbiE
VWSETFDRAADSYDSPVLRFFDINAAALARAVPLPSGAVILDVATGTGKVAVAAAEAGGLRARVVGIDVSEQMLTRAQKRASGLPVEFRQMDARALEFPSQTFDAVLCGHAISFFRPHLLSCVKQMNRVLKSGGWIGFSTFDEHAFMPATRLLVQRLNENRAGGSDSRKTRWMRLDRPRYVRRLLKEGHFSDHRVIRLKTTYPLERVEDWWTYFWGSAWRGALGRLAESDLQLVRQGLLEDLGKLPPSEALQLNATAHIGVGRRR